MEGSTVTLLLISLSVVWGYSGQEDNRAAKLGGTGDGLGALLMLPGLINDLIQASSIPKK